MLCLYFETSLYILLKFEESVLFKMLYCGRRSICPPDGLGRDQKHGEHDHPGS